MTGPRVAYTVHPAAGPRAFTARQVAALLQLHYKTVLDLLADGQIRGVKFGPHWRIPDHEIERLLRPANGDEVA